MFPWAEEALGDGATPEVLDSTNGIPVEKVAALRPDLIIGIYSGMTQEEYDLLSKLAPTIAQTGRAAFFEPWRDQASTIGQAMFRHDDMQKLVTDVDAGVSREESVDQAAVTFDPTIVRGLEYYTGAVFEAELLLETADDKGRPVRFGSIGGGGRYDDLVARFTGQSTPATGPQLRSASMTSMTSSKVSGSK